MAASRFQRGRTALLVAIVLLDGCSLGVPTASTKGRSPTTVSPAEVVTGHGGGLVVDSKNGQVVATGAGLIGDAGGSLVGRVRVPASLISNNGGNVISDQGSGVVANNGGKVIANNGASFRLQAADEIAVAGAEVWLVQADGTPVLDESKQPIKTVTDAEGRYRLPVAANQVNLLVQVGVASASGNMLAFVPRGASQGERTVDVTLVSTLVMGYILDQYVKGQTDRQLTLDKLPVDVEAETRLRAAAALGTGAVAAPTTLEVGHLVKTVDALRARDTAFDGQMETVKKLLVAAGQSDLGNGRVATQVGLGIVDEVVRMPDGELFFSCRSDNRVWRLTADGRLFTAMGRSRVTVDASVDGKQGADVAIGTPIAITRDGNGLLVLEENRLTRLGADGKVNELATALIDAAAVWATGGGSYQVIEGGHWALRAKKRGPAGEEPDLVTVFERPARILAIEAGKPATSVHTFSERETEQLRLLRRAATVASGVVALGVEIVTTTQVNQPEGQEDADEGMTVSRPQILHLKLADFALTVAHDADPAIFQSLTMDDAGTPIWQRLGKLELEIGSPAAIKELLPKPLYAFQPVSLQGDTVFHVAYGDKIYRLDAGEKTMPTVIAGAVDPPRSGRADEIALLNPTLVAADHSGKLFIFDEGNARLWEIGIDGNAHVIFEAPPVDSDAPPFIPGLMRVDSNGQLVILEGGRKGSQLLKFGGAGKPVTLFKTDPVAGESIVDFFPRPAGGYLVLLEEVSDGGSVMSLVDIGEEGVTKTSHPLGPLGLIESLAVTSKGAVYLASPYELFSWSATTGLKLLPIIDVASDDFQPFFDWFDVDGQGRLIAPTAIGIRRLDPTTGEIKDLVGYEGGPFQGTGVDDSVGQRLVSPCLDGAGNLYFLDLENRQVKGIPAAEIR